MSYVSGLVATRLDSRCSSSGKALLVALKKSDLYSSLWASCDQLRAAWMLSALRDRYILTLLFVKYVSDKAKAGFPVSLIDVPNGGSFDDMLSAKNDKEIGDRFQQDHRQACRRQRSAQRHRPGRLQRRGEARQGQGDGGSPSKLVTMIFNDLDFRGSCAEGDDLLGDAYEYFDAQTSPRNPGRARVSSTPLPRCPASSPKLLVLERIRVRPNCLRPGVWFRFAATQGEGRKLREVCRSTARRRTTPPGRYPR